MPGLTLSGGPGFCNAVRRAIIGHVTSWAPYELTIRANTSCHTDEYLAHRIGLMAFRRVGSGTTMTLTKTGPGIARAGDIVGCDFQSVHPGTEIAALGKGDTLDVTIHFNEGNGTRHARYSPCAAVGMRLLDGSGRHRITFELHDSELNVTKVVHEALDALDASVADALRQLAHQPAEFPRTRC